MFFDSRHSYIRWRVAGVGGVILMPASSFAFDGQHVFLTYPQSGELTRERVRDFFVEQSPLCDYVVARESHADGGYHIHAYIRWPGRIRRTGADCFDVDGRHPNVQRPGSAKRVIAYIRKSDTEPLVSEGLRGDAETDIGWGGLLKRAKSDVEFLRLAREFFPRDYVLNFSRLVEFARAEFGEEETTFTVPENLTFEPTEDMLTWVSHAFAEVSAH